jgi:hypothetical protein
LIQASFAGFSRALARPSAPRRKRSQKRGQSVVGPSRPAEKDFAMQPAIQQVIRALAEDGRAGAMNIAEHAVDSYLAGAVSEGDRALSRDILVRDLASLRGVAPHLAAFIGRVETYVAKLAPPSLSRAA